MRTKSGTTYIMTNKTNTTLYVGVTSNLKQRVDKHKTGFYANSFSKRYKLHKLVYFEGFSRIEEAIAREKQLKAGSRKKKEDLIIKVNPDWKDLYSEIND